LDELFAPEAADIGLPRNASGRTWRVLVVDDDPEVHAVTELALRGFEFDGVPIEILSVYSAAEARAFLRSERRHRIALILLDVVMETEHAGLDLVRFVREEMKNPVVRICLRTGQPGSAPERAVISGYDINDYKSKTELSAQRLFTTVLASLRAYRDIVALERSRRGLEHILMATPDLFDARSLGSFASGALEQLMAMIRSENSAVYVKGRAMAFVRRSADYEVLAGIGDYRHAVGRSARETLPARIVDGLRLADGATEAIVGDGWLAVSAMCGTENTILHLEVDGPVDAVDRRLVEVFARQMGLAFSNIRLNESIAETQRQLVLVLSEAIEARSRETGNHVRRVAHGARLLAELAGLPAAEQATLEVAAPLHDIGKITIPDAILTKPGKLDPGEWETMKTHAAAGADILAKSDGPFFRAGATIAIQHHEKWDGSGYPAGLAGEDIHIFGRIVALIDVFDALCSARCYKKAWPAAQAAEHIASEAGRHFDPRLVRLFVENLDRFAEIRETYPDTP
jgi:response regulator RpfG family c-di-GMP phosphodiesterase